MLNTIQTVKEQGNGYLLNGNMSVPKADGNSEYELIKLWLAEGNEPEPEFTEAEIAQQEVQKKLQEVKNYLSSTDFYYARFLETGEAVPEAVVLKRTESREFIRANTI